MGRYQRKIRRQVQALVARAAGWRLPRRWPGRRRLSLNEFLKD